MGNSIIHRRIIIDFDTWEPFKHDVEKDLDKLGEMVNTKQILGHAGNVHVHFEDEMRKETK